MPYGLFGKVPQKRDFMSVQMPTAVLSPFETWLQSAVAASRNELGRAWQDHYLVAPIWRFWIGEQILGTRVAGALMPSVDQVGRYFPLSILYFADAGEYLPPPLLSPLEHWYGAIEQRLLRALSEETDGYLTSVLHGLEPPREMAVRAEPAPSDGAEPDPSAQEPATDESSITAGSLPLDPPAEESHMGTGGGNELTGSTVGEPEAPVPVETLPDSSPFDDSPAAEIALSGKDGPVTIPFKGGHTLEVPAGQTLAEAIGMLREADYGHTVAGRSYFWCAASRMGPARIHGRQGLPDPYFFSRMILWERGPA